MRQSGRAAPLQDGRPAPCRVAGGVGRGGDGTGSAHGRACLPEDGRPFARRKRPPRAAWGLRVAE
ncbi:hypothetical protein DA2_2058 [Desulfovibrio sp. A2]|nr:hypothetical protein DA2_2058 [Desulfovibrio sp. A2]